MAEAKVESTDAIKAFRRALIKFAELANSALTDAEADAGHTLMWLETEQRTYWTNNVRKASELVSRCEDAVRQKKIFMDSSGRPQSAVDEEKALAKAKRLKEHAEEKAANVKKYAPRLHREILLYKGQVQRLATFVAADVPAAIQKLDKIVATLDEYFALQAPDAVSSTAVTQPTGEVGAEVTEHATAPRPETFSADGAPDAKPQAEDEPSAVVPADPAPLAASRTEPRDAAEPQAREEH